MTLKMKFKSLRITDIFNQAVPLISCRSTYKIKVNGILVHLNLFSFEICRFKIIHKTVQAQTVILESSCTACHFAHRQFMKL